MLATLGAIGFALTAIAGEPEGGEAPKTAPADRSGLLIAYQLGGTADAFGGHRAMGVSLHYRERYGRLGWQITAVDGLLPNGGGLGVASVAALGPVFYASRSDWSGLYGGAGLGLGLVSDPTLETSRAYPLWGPDLSAYVGYQLIPGLGTGGFVELGLSGGLYQPGSYAPDDAQTRAAARVMLRVGVDKALGPSLVGAIPRRLANR